MTYRRRASHTQQEGTQKKQPGSATPAPIPETISTPAQRLAEARTLTQKARGNFGGSSVIGANPSVVADTINDFDACYSSRKNIAAINAALSDSLAAVAKWRELLPLLKPGSPETFEAYLSLGELYSERSKLITWNSCRFTHERMIYLLASLRSLEAMQKSFSYMELAMRCKEHPSLPELEAQPLKARLMWEHESLSYCYSALCGAYMQLGEKEKAEKAAKLDYVHRALRSKLGEELYGGEE